MVKAFIVGFILIAAQNAFAENGLIRCTTAIHVPPATASSEVLLKVGNKFRPGYTVAIIDQFEVTYFGRRVKRIHFAIESVFGIGDAFAGTAIEPFAMRLDAVAREYPSGSYYTPQCTFTPIL